MYENDKRYLSIAQTMITSNNNDYDTQKHPWRAGQREMEREIIVDKRQRQPRTTIVSDVTSIYLPFEMDARKSLFLPPLPLSHSSPHINSFVLLLRIWNSVADPSNYTDNIASSSSSPLSSLNVIDELNESGQNKWKRRERKWNERIIWLRKWHWQSKKESKLSLVTLRLHATTFALCVVGEIGNFRRDIETEPGHTIQRREKENTILTEILKVNVYHFVSKHVHGVYWCHWCEKMEERERRRRREKKIWIAFWFLLLSD